MFVRRVAARIPALATTVASSIAAATAGAASMMPTQAWQGARRIVIHCEAPSVSGDRSNRFCAAIRAGAETRSILPVVDAASAEPTRGDVKLRAALFPSGDGFRISLAIEAAAPRGEGGEAPAVAPIQASAAAINSGDALRRLLAQPLDRLLAGGSRAPAGNIKL